MKSFLFTSVIFLSIAARKCSSQPTGSPSCIQEKIDSISRQPRWNPPAEVHEYEYNGVRVFLFSSDCCDQYQLLYTATCEIICAPSGGMTGKGDRRCTDFSAKAKHIRLVWKDDRS